MRRSARQVQHFVRAPPRAPGPEPERLFSARAAAPDDRRTDAMAEKARGALPDASFIEPARAVAGGSVAQRTFPAHSKKVLRSH
jgi:hypothetical protein